ncbi:MAG TPA: response regulator [Pyrinomonadaceae bacterium]
MSDSPKAKCRILCVDDHHDTSEMLKLLLSEEDYEVKIAATIEEACELAVLHEFDLYVLDKRLPDGSGVDLCSRLQQLTPGVPCIFYTGDAYEIHRLEAMEAGAVAYIPKPDIDGLIDAVHKLLSERECATA